MIEIDDTMRQQMYDGWNGWSIVDMLAIPEDGDVATITLTRRYESANLDTGFRVEWKKEGF